MVIIPGAVLVFNRIFGGRRRTMDNAWIERFGRQLNMTRATFTPVTMGLNSEKAHANILTTIIRKNTTQLKYHRSNALNNL
jgi:hypothetical protein